MQGHAPGPAMRMRRAGSCSARHRAEGAGERTGQNGCLAGYAPEASVSAVDQLEVPSSRPIRDQSGTHARMCLLRPRGLQRGARVLHRAC